MPSLKDEPRRSPVVSPRRLSLLTVGEPAALGPVERLARDLGFDVVSRTRVDVLEEIRRVGPDAVFVDLGESEVNGIQMLRAIREVRPRAASS